LQVGLTIAGIFPVLLNAASAKLSVSNCRINRKRPAPNAIRTANSLRRSAPRASNRLATFAHAISSTSPTIIISIRNGCAMVLRKGEYPVAPASK